MASRFRRAARPADIWPGFVDALSTLLLVLIFLLVIFVVAEFFLGRVLSGRESELADLRGAIVELEGLLSIEQDRSRELDDDLAATAARLATANSDLDAAAAARAAGEERAGELRLRLAEAEAALAAALADGRAAAAGAARSRDALDAERRLSDDARLQVSLLNRQIGALRAQLRTVQEALDISESAVGERDVQIADLGQRLNVALASQVQELRQARSVFFGRLRDVLGGRSDVRIDGDRFVIQSGVLFTSGSDELGAEGLGQVADLAGLLIQIAREIPDDVNWVLRIDGHTDKRPINTERFRSNWALSSARAITVARALIDNGVPPRRLMAAGFGEFQPIDDRETEDAFRRNRRIELKLTQR